jgi:hypothetical protein
MTKKYFLPIKERGKPGRICMKMAMIRRRILIAEKEKCGRVLQTL